MNFSLLLWLKTEPIQWFGNLLLFWIDEFSELTSKWHSERILSQTFVSFCRMQIIHFFVARQSNQSCILILKDVIVNGLLCVHILCERVLCTEFRFRFASIQPNWMVCAGIFNKVKPISMNESNDWLCSCNSYVNKHTQTHSHTFCEFDDKLSTSDLLLFLFLYAG